MPAGDTGAFCRADRLYPAADQSQRGYAPGSAGDAAGSAPAGVQALPRKRWADLDDRSNMENVWKQYHALGGNGDMKDLRKTFRHLPMVPGGQPVVVDED